MIVDHSSLFGVFAHPVGHSMSPIMHNAAFAYLELNGHYHAFDIHPDDLEQAVHALPILGIGGVNVTIPHKERMMQYMDEIDEEAHVIGAVNTVVVQPNGRLYGYNTDGAGYVRSLTTETDVQLDECRTLLLGAGGAAKALAVYLLKNGCPELTVVNRTAEKAQRLANQLTAYSDRYALTGAVHVGNWNMLCEEEVEGGSVSTLPYDLIINTTAIGMWPNVQDTPLVASQIDPSTVVSDIVYNPLETRLLKEARKSGATVHGGLGMFVYQGALAFEYFTGHDAPATHMREVVENQLRRRNGR